MSEPKTTNGPLSEEDLPLLFHLSDKKLPYDCKPMDCTTFWKTLRGFIEQLRKLNGGKNNGQ